MHDIRSEGPVRGLGASDGATGVSDDFEETANDQRDEEIGPGGDALKDVQACGEDEEFDEEDGGGEGGVVVVEAEVVDGGHLVESDWFS